MYTPFPRYTVISGCSRTALVWKLLVSIQSHMNVKQSTLIRYAAQQKNAQSSTAALPSRMVSDGRTVNQSVLLNIVWQHDGFGKVALLHYQGHLQSHRDHLTQQLQQKKGLPEKPSLEDHNPHTFKNQRGCHSHIQITNSSFNPVTAASTPQSPYPLLFTFQLVLTNPQPHGVSPHPMLIAHIHLSCSLKGLVSPTPKMCYSYQQMTDTIPPVFLWLSTYNKEWQSTNTQRTTWT